MGSGQPFYNYGNGQNNGFVAQPSQQSYFGAQQPQMPSQQPLPLVPPKTNKILVTSLMDAMSRTAELNTEILYIDQDNPFIYQVTIDMQGRKSYKTFEIKEVNEQNQTQMGAPNIDLAAYATKDDLKALEDKLIAMASNFVAPKSKAKLEKTGGEEQ